MTRDSKVEELLTRWELSRLEGNELRPEQLAADHPDLIDKLREGIEVLKATAWVVDGSSTQDYLAVHKSDQDLPDSDLNASELLAAAVEMALISDEQIERAKREISTEVTAHALAEWLVREGFLTRYQARALLTAGASPLILDRYVILDQIGSGGMGIVYKALHRSMNRVVALKVLPEEAVDSPEKVARFQQEIRATARLSHPNIVAAHDAHEVQGRHFLVMEYVTGKNLKELVAQQGPLLVREATKIIATVADALGAAHRAGIIHRDVKPSNIILSDEGVPKLLDLGLVRVWKASDAGMSSIGITLDGVPMGTAAYMAPEQALDSGEADARADVYSLGCIFYWLLTGQAPVTIHPHVQFPWPGQTSPGLLAQTAEIPDSVASICQQMMALRVGERFQSVDEVIAALNEL